MDYSSKESDTYSSKYLMTQSIILKINWRGEGVTYQRVIPPKESKNGWPNQEIEARLSLEHDIFFEKYLVGFEVR